MANAVTGGAQERSAAEGVGEFDRPGQIGGSDDLPDVTTVVDERRPGDPDAAVQTWVGPGVSSGIVKSGGGGLASCDAGDRLPMARPNASLASSPSIATESPKSSSFSASLAVSFRNCVWEGTVADTRNDVVLCRSSASGMTNDPATSKLTDSARDEAS